MITKTWCFIILGFIYPAKISAEIELDYFYGKASMRSPKGLKCETAELVQRCSQQCGRYNYGCLFGECSCHDTEMKVKPKRAGENMPPSPTDIKMMIADFEDLIEVARRYILESRQSVNEERPALRHHIAHFCPNLGVARECIWSCMKVGKPAFCGKDHQCYCGHKYSDHDTHQKVDVKDVYAQFRDLYTKYFGPENGEEVTIMEDNKGNE